MEDTSKVSVGRRGEDLADWYLSKKGYQIIKRHFTCRFGEIDLIARDQAVLVFVEVKMRLGEGYGEPEQAVTRRKMQRLKRAIYVYLSQNQAEDFRIDVVAIIYNQTRGTMTFRHHKSISEKSGF